jgi:hypothetical protein
VASRNLCIPLSCSSPPVKSSSLFVGKISRHYAQKFRQLSRSFPFIPLSNSPLAQRLCFRGLSFYSHTPNPRLSVPVLQCICQFHRAIILLTLFLLSLQTSVATLFLFLFHCKSSPGANGGPSIPVLLNHLPFLVYFLASSSSSVWRYQDQLREPIASVNFVKSVLPHCRFFELTIFILPPYTLSSLMNLHLPPYAGANGIRVYVLSIVLIPPCPCFPFVYVT